MGEMIAASIGAVMGAVFAYGFGFLQQRTDRARKRRALASVLLTELRAVDATMRSAYDNPQGLIPGTSFQSLDLVAEAIEVLEPATVCALLDVRDYLDGTRVLLDRLATGEVQRTPVRDAMARVYALAGIQRIPVLKAALEREGGRGEPFIPTHDAAARPGRHQRLTSRAA